MYVGIYFGTRLSDSARVLAASRFMQMTSGTPFRESWLLLFLTEAWEESRAEQTIFSGVKGPDRIGDVNCERLSSHFTSGKLWCPPPKKKKNLLAHLVSPLSPSWPFLLDSLRFATVLPVLSSFIKPDMTHLQA